MKKWETAKTIDTDVGLPPDYTIRSLMDNSSESTVEFIGYNDDTILFDETVDLDSIKELDQRYSKKWIIISGLKNDHLYKILTDWGVHMLTMEDILGQISKPKIEEHGNHIYSIIATPKLADNEIETGYIHNLLFKDKVVTLISDDSVCSFNQIKNRLNSENSKIRKNGSGYLFYAVMDLAVDKFLLTYKEVEEMIEVVDECLAKDYDEGQVEDIKHLKRMIIQLKKDAVSMNNISKWLRDTDSDLFRDDVNIFIDDLRDHTSFLVDNLESSKETLMDLHQLYLAMTSTRMNEIMRLLTIITAIFIPLSFITGIYGMNFAGLPGLSSNAALASLALLMITLAGGMLYIFHRKKWI